MAAPAPQPVGCARVPCSALAAVCSRWENSVQSHGRPVQVAGPPVQPFQLPVQPSGRCVQTSGRFVQRFGPRVQGIGDRVQRSGRLVQPVGRLVQPWNRLVHRNLYKTGTFYRFNSPVRGQIFVAPRLEVFAISHAGFLPISASKISRTVSGLIVRPSLR
jgi:hypothetical protein